MRRSFLLRSQLHDLRSNTEAMKVAVRKGIKPTGDRELAAMIIAKYKSSSKTIENSRVVRIAMREMMTDVRENIHIAGVETYTKAIQVCAKFKSPELGRRVWDEMVERGIKPKHHTYVALASAHASVGHLRDVVSLLDETGYESHAAKGTLLRAYAKAKHTEAMMKCFHHFISDGFVLTPRHAVVMLSGQTDPREAWGILITLRNSYGIAPNTIICNAALGSCINGPDPQVAEQIVFYMQERRIKKDSSTWSTLCAVYSQACNLQKVEETLSAQVDANVDLNAHSFATYVRCCTNVAKLKTTTAEEKKRLTAQAEAMYHQGVHSTSLHSSHLHTNMLDFYISQDSPAGIRKMVELMEQQLVKPSRKFTEQLTAYRTTGAVALDRKLQVDTSYRTDAVESEEALDEEIVVAHSKGVKQSPKTGGLFGEETTYIQQAIHHGDMKLRAIPIDPDTKVWARNTDDYNNFKQWSLPKRRANTAKNADAWKTV